MKKRSYMGEMIKKHLLLTMQNMTEKSWKIKTFMGFHAISSYVCERKNTLCSYFTCENGKHLCEKTCQKWKIEQFSKTSKIIKTAPNHVLNSRKNSYRVFEPESKEWKKFIMPMFGKMNFSCHGCVFYHFWKSEKIHFCS